MKKYKETKCSECPRIFANMVGRISYPIRPRDDAKTCSTRCSRLRADRLRMELKRKKKALAKKRTERC